MINKYIEINIIKEMKEHCKENFYTHRKIQGDGEIPKGNGLAESTL